MFAYLSVILMHGCSFEEDQEIIPTTHSDTKTLNIGNLVEDRNFKEYVSSLNALGQKYNFNSGQLNNTVSNYYNEQMSLGKNQSTR